jgi:hypothetical protein
MRDQALWRLVVMAIIGGGMLTLTVLAWFGRGQPVHVPPLTGSATQGGAPTQNSCWKFRTVVRPTVCPSMPKP